MTVMEETGNLIRTVRERHGISREQLAIRAGCDETAVAQIECGHVEPTAEDLRMLLLVMGERPVEENGRMSSEPIPLEFDPGELADAARQAPSERLERSALWNRFAAQLARADQRPLR